MIPRRPSIAEGVIFLPLRLPQCEAWHLIWALCLLIADNVHLGGNSILRTRKSVVPARCCNISGAPSRQPTKPSPEQWSKLAG
ncbi:hypothetical protein SBA4_5580006 [Candidatus Sulfopaludibacter sp. SbA4]|nr:hypothetical protein SBA4_5580006 [Candidatus Sulfopaludibacter sp. SbA4]